MLYAIEISFYDYVWFTLKARKVSLQVVSNCEAMAVQYNNCDFFNKKANNLVLLHDPNVNSQ